MRPAAATPATEAYMTKLIYSVRLALQTVLLHLNLVPDITSEPLLVSCSAQR